MTNFKEGLSREQYIMFPEIIDDYINEENPVRFIDAFVENLDLLALDFTNAVAKERGTSAYNPKDLLKLYIYGYLNKIRSSRKLENETHRNVELMWLLRKLKPDFKTIADFRKDNLKGIQNVCKQFTLLCRELGLLSSDLVAIDGSKFKACNNKSNNYSEKSLDKHIKYTESKINEYLKELDENDNSEKHQKKLTKEELSKKIDKLKNRMKKFNDLKKEFETSDVKQISTVDKDSSLIKDKQGFIVGYNVQTAVESENHLIIAYDVVQSSNDLNQLSSMAKQAKEIINKDELKVTADTGYHNEEEILKVIENNITPYVFKQEGSPNDKKGLFTYHDFIYNKEKDIYLCPGNQELKLRGFGKSKKRILKYYYTTACNKCLLKDNCTKDKTGRRIGRSVNADVMELMEERMKQEPEIGKQRKQLVEHPFGTIKRSFDQEFFLLKGLEKVKTEISLSILSYNMKRVMNIIGINRLMQYMTT